MDEQYGENKNVLCINCSFKNMNFFNIVMKNSKFNYIHKYNISNITLESYDAYIIDLFAFSSNTQEGKKFFDKVLSFKKPVLFVYSLNIKKEYEGIKYLSNKFSVVFEEKDSSIIVDSLGKYLPSTNFDNALSMRLSKGIGKAYIKNTNNCFIAKFGNVSIIHDIDMHNFINNKDEKIMAEELLNNLFAETENVERPIWVDDIKILNEKTLQKEIDEKKLQISNLEIEKNEKEERIQKIQEYKKTLYSTGDELVNIVKTILTEMLDISINDKDLKKEDLSFDIDNKKVLVEIKGVNTSIKREHVSQLQRHIEDHAKENGVDDEDISSNYKGLLIINPYSKIPLNERVEREFYSKTVQSDIEHYKICAIDTITLLGLFNDFRMKGNVNLKNIILNNNYTIPNFDIVKIDGITQ